MPAVEDGGVKVGRPQLSYANVVSTGALFVALGGTSYAVARNSVGTGITSWPE